MEYLLTFMTRHPATVIKVLQQTIVLPNLKTSGKSRMFEEQVELSHFLWSMSTHRIVTFEERSMSLVALKHKSAFRC